MNPILPKEIISKILYEFKGLQHPVAKVFNMYITHYDEELVVRGHLPDNFFFIFSDGDDREVTFSEYMLDNIKWTKIANYTFNILNVELKERHIYIHRNFNF